MDFFVDRAGMRLVFRWLGWHGVLCRTNEVHNPVAHGPPQRMSPTS